MVRRIAASFFAVATLALTVAAAPSPPESPPVRLRPQLGLASHPADVHLFTNARVVVSPGRAFERGELLVRGGKVVAVGERVEAPAGAARHDLGGATVFPGFVEPFDDYGVAAEEQPAGPRRRGTRYESEEPGAGSWNEAVHAERDWVDAFVPDPKAAEKLRKRGVVAVQSARLDGVFRGRAFVATTADGGAADVVISPASRHFASFDKGSSTQEYPSSLMGSIALVRQTLLDARWSREAAAAGVRVEVDRAVAALAANREPIVFETGDVASQLRAARIADETGVPFIHVGSGETWQALVSIRRAGAPVILPLHFPKVPAVSSLGDELDVTVGALRVWERTPGAAGELAAVELELALSGHGLGDDEDFLVNLRTAVARGLDTDSALAALTTVPARLAGVDDRLGTLEPGKDASFVVVTGDLFHDDKSEIVAVWIAGAPAFEREPPGSRDWRGTWTLRVGERSGTLTLRGERGLRGELEVGETSVDLDDASVALGGLTLVVPAKAWGEDGSVRVGLRSAGERIEGEAALPSGAIVAASLTPAAAPEATAAKDDAEEDDPGKAGERGGWGRDRRNPATAVLRETDLVSNRVFPNVGLGVAKPAEPEDVLVRGATVWTLEGEGVVENADLLVRGGKIAAVGRGLEAPSGVRVIDAAGRHVTPGIIDEHSHLAISGGVNEGSHAVTAEVRIGDVVDPSDVGIWRALGGGVTAAQLLHGSANPIGGQAQIIKLRWGRTSEELKLAGATPTIKFALGENVKQSNWGDDNTTRYPQSRLGVETLMRDRFHAAQEYAAGWKAWNALPAKERQGKVAPRRDLQLETLAEILAGERLVHCHSYVQSEILSTMRLAEELGFRIGTFTHILEGYKVAPEMAKHGVGASSFSDWWAYKFEVYDAIPQNTCLLSRAGVLASVNSDSEELIRHLNQEAAKSVLYCGMSEVEALKLATLNPARQLEIDGRTGSLAVGKDADFVIWSGHPLSTSSRAEETWVDGAPVFTRALDAELRAKLAEEKKELVEKALRAGGGREEEGPGRGRGRRVWHCDDVEDFWNVDDAR